MKPSILIVMLDFLVCSLLMFVIGTGGEHSQLATSAPAPAVHEEFTPAALQAQQEEWNRDYDQQALLTQLHTESTENEQLRSQLNTTSATLATREANLKQLTEEKTKVEQAKAQTEQALSSVETQLTHVQEERQKLAQEGAATKESLGKLQAEFTGLQAQQAKLQQERAQLEQHAEQLGQTVASQQATITTLSDEVRASQIRSEAQLADIGRSQLQMGTTLDQLSQFARTLPAAIQKSVASVNDQQLAMQTNMAALAEDVKELQASLNPEDRALLMQAVANMTKGQQDLQSKLDDMVQNGQTDYGQTLSKIEAGQDALRVQTAKLGDEIESIKSRGPGPFQAVKGARIELTAAITTHDTSDDSYAHFKSTAYPPVVRVNNRSFIVANSQALGFAWWGLGPLYSRETKITDLRYSIARHGESNSIQTLTGSACALKADPHVVAVELSQPPPGLTTMDLAAPGQIFQSDERKLYIFKTTAAGLSFEADTVPDLGDARYIMVKRNLRGPATWFENPAYRPETGDYMVTADGKLVGIMISREKCLVLNKDTILACALSVSLSDRQQLQRGVVQLSKLK
jgi:hypothetical protein